MSIVNDMMLTSKAGKRLFSSVIEVAVANKQVIQPAEDIDSKRARIHASTDPCCSTTTTTNDERMQIESVQTRSANHQEVENRGVSPLKRAIFIDAHVQTDLTLDNCVISPIPKPPSTISLVSALISPPKTPPARTSPLLTRAKSTVSISNVSNVSVSKKLTSFSSMCSIDVPSTTATAIKMDENGTNKRTTTNKAMIKRPRLKHTRTAAVDGTDEPSESTFAMPNKKRCVNFGSVDVYSFEFRQSYDTVPTEGGVPLGMEDKHHDVKHYASYRDFQLERFAENTDKYSLDSNMLGSKRRRVRQQDPDDSVIDQFRANRRAAQPGTSKLTPDSKWTTSDEEFVEENKKRPLSSIVDRRKRQQIVYSNKIKLDQDINDECLRIKQSRLDCGCSCSNGLCLPESCQCSLDGVGCLVDRPSFPCACTTSSCRNPSGRHEFDECKVKEHYKKTVKRLNADKQKQEPDTLRRILPKSQSSSTISALIQSPLTHSFEKLELKTPPPAKAFLKSPSLGSKITTQFSPSGSISLPFTSPPQNVTQRRRKRYPVTPTFRHEDLSTNSTEPFIIELDSTLTGQNMDVDDSVQFLEEIPGPTTRSNKQPKMTGNAVEICEVVITSPINNNTELPLTNPDFSLASINTQTSLLSAASRSLSAATTTTDETSRTNSTEEFTIQTIRID